MKNILIVGGGTAGYVSALILKKRFGDNINLTLVKSDKIGIIGVGEGSTEHWSEFMRYVGIDYKEIIKECDATLKLGIMFKNWSTDDYFHSIDFLNKIKFSQTLTGYQKLISENCKQQDLNNVIYWNNKVPVDCLNNNYCPSAQFHFNTFKLNNFLNKKCIQNNINIEEDEINEVSFKENGEIKNVKGIKNIYEYDFYLDCTGFKKFLITKLGGEWNSYKNYLKMKEAIAFPTEDTEEYNTFTNAIAMDYGWMFQIPTYGRQGNGYIFDSDYINVEKAKEEVEKKLNKKINIAKHIKFDPGALKKVWIKNCVAVGLSANFVEPLEATSIGTTIQQIFLLNHYLLDYDEVQIQEYNSKINSIMDNIKDFLVLHYLTKKQNTNFWKDLNNIVLPDSLKQNMLKWKNRLPIDEDFYCYNTKYILFGAENFTHILYGLNFLNTKKLKDNLNFLNKDYLNFLNVEINDYINKKNENKEHILGHKQYLNIIRND
jgi:tryptophan halogenase